MIEPIPKPTHRKNKVSKDWLAFRSKWIKENPPDYRGAWVCGICSELVHMSSMELDHIKSRSTHPHLRFDSSNVRPAHRSCNQGR